MGCEYPLPVTAMDVCFWPLTAGQRTFPMFATAAIQVFALVSRLKAGSELLY